MSYRKYLQKIRMERAAELLTDTSMTIAEISAYVGFQDYFYFIKAFKSWHMISPGQYRKQHRGR